MAAARMKNNVCTMTDLVGNSQQPCNLLVSSSKGLAQALYFNQQNTQPCADGNSKTSNCVLCGFGVIRTAVYFASRSMTQLVLPDRQQALPSAAELLSTPHSSLGKYLALLGVSHTL